MHRLPISRVVVMEDRAQVERTGTVQLDGVTRLEVPGVTTLAVDRSLRVEVAGATLLDAKLVRRWKEVPTGGLGADASDSVRHRHALMNALGGLEDGLTRKKARQALLASARVDLLRAIAEAAGAGVADSALWATDLARLSEAQAANNQAVLESQHAINQTLQRLRELEHAIASTEGAPRTLECSLALTIEGQGEARVTVGYLVPCAAWRPAYRATLRADSSVLVEAEAVVWQRTEEAWEGVQLMLSTARPTLGTSPPVLIEDRLFTRPKSNTERRSVDVAVREEVIQRVGERGGANELPGLDDGGETRLIEAHAKAAVPSDGQPHRVPLFRFEGPATLERVCSAELTPLVTLVARLPNTSGKVLLAGPVEVIRTNGYVGRAVLSFTAPNEMLKLSFGSEDALRVMRRATQKTEESLITNRRTTVHTIELHISNASAERAHVVIEERVPVSEVKDVEVEVLKKDSKPAPSELSPQGIARLPLELPAQGTQTATLVWKLSAAASVVGV